MGKNRIEIIEGLLNDCSSQQEEERVLRAALVYCSDSRDRSRLQLWLMTAQNPPKDHSKPQPGNPNLQPDPLLNEIIKGLVLEVAFDVLREAPEQYKSKKYGFKITPLKSEVAVRVSDRLTEMKKKGVIDENLSAPSESTVYRILKDQRHIIKFLFSDSLSSSDE